MPARKLDFRNIVSHREVIHYAPCSFAGSNAVRRRAISGLNPWLWPQLLPGLFDGYPKTLFVGIGSILGDCDFYEPTAMKVFFGAGYVSSYHHQVPNVHGADWISSSFAGREARARLVFRRVSASATLRSLYSSLAPRIDERRVLSALCRTGRVWTVENGRRFVISPASG
jgi:hypothetical protein